MLKTTNLLKVKEIAIAFLFQPIDKTNYSPLIVQHPIFESGFQNAVIDGEITQVNILEDKDKLKELQNLLCKRIKEAESLQQIYNIIRQSYQLTFLKYTKRYLSLIDFSDILAYVWVSSENPNGDINVDVPTLASWFRESDKKVLMTEEDYIVYESLPEILTVYRGIAVGRNPQGLSWTQNHSTAEWFSKRFDTDTKKGYIQKAVINKSQALAYFNTRNEDELVVDTKGLTITIESAGHKNY